MHYMHTIKIRILLHVHLFWQCMPKHFKIWLMGLGFKDMTSRQGLKDLTRFHFKMTPIFIKIKKTALEKWYL